MKTNVRNIILKLTKEKIVLSLCVFFSAVLAIIIALIPPLVLADIIDALTSGKEIHFNKILLYFGTIALGGLLESAREGFLTIYGQKITHALRSALMKKYTNLTTDNITKQEPGAIVSRFIGDADTVEALFTSGIISMFSDACKIISILIIIYFNNKGLFLILLIVIPLFFFFTRHVQKNMLQSQLQNRKAVAKASGFVPETIHCIRTIHNLLKETYMEEKYDAYIEDSYKAMEKTNFYDAIYSPVVLILNALVVGIVMLLSASNNATILNLFGMSAGTAVAVMSYITDIFTPIESLGTEIQTIQSALAGVKRIDAFLALEEKEVKEEKYGGTSFVEFQDVTFGYDEKQILNHFNLNVKEGEQVTLSGRTGCGKSTAFKLLLGLYEPQGGEIYVGGIVPSTIKEKDKRKLYGYVEQSFHMVTGSIKDQITLYDESISISEVKEAARLVGLDQTIESFEKGYDTPCTQELFSQGQWQLLSIARAIVSRPKLLLLDEITANLDVETEKEVLQALENASKDRTVISISHRTNAKTGKVISM